MDSPLEGATVTLYDADGVQVGDACTTDATGVCQFDDPVPGDYSVTIAAAGSITVTRAIPGVTCSADVTVTMSKGIFFLVTGCGCAVEGAEIAITKTAGSGAPYSETLTTDVNGRAQAGTALAAGQSYDYTITATRYTTESATRNITVNACSISITAALTTDPLYWCFGGQPARCRELIATEVFATLPNHTFFGSLAGTTVTIPRSNPAPTGNPNDYFFVTVPYLKGGINSYMSFVVAVTNNGLCADPGGNISAYDTNSGGLTGSGAATNFPLSSGTSACPIAWIGTHVTRGDIVVTE